MVRHLLFLEVLPLIALLLTGCETPGGTGSAAPTTTNTLGEAYHDAETVTAGGSGRHTALGRGDSMAPIYGNDTLLVINPIKFEELKPGMTVAYLNRQNMRVVHKLVSKTRDGWMVAGFNNARIDDELVTPQNLLGVVYVTLYPTGEDEPH
jgi:hypothetical protein